MLASHTRLTISGAVLNSVDFSCDPLLIKGSIPIIKAYNVVYIDMGCRLCQNANFIHLIMHIKCIDLIIHVKVLAI